MDPSPKRSRQSRDGPNVVVCESSSEQEEEVLAEGCGLCRCPGCKRNREEMGKEVKRLVKKRVKEIVKPLIKDITNQMVHFIAGNVDMHAQVGEEPDPEDAAAFLPAGEAQPAGGDHGEDAEPANDNAGGAAHHGGAEQAAEGAQED
eukprot:TRINITY_DN3103_c0_g1_i2.p1 TRINITY_DN3103_c0_g1~~TRINITY_DN3103_c0_g1_i2.p1  ORF type:complete len:147 (-),score=32.51 TRINITY_DN3103_c0_g1_i2:93-533(-)